VDQPTARSISLAVAALARAGASATPAQLIPEAAAYAAWILGEPGLTAMIAVAAAVDGKPVILGGTMPQTVNATADNATVTLVAAETDDHGNRTSDQLVWANDDAANAIATWAVSADTKTCTGTLTHTEGVVNITLDDPASPAVGTTQIQLIVGPGPTSKISVTATVA
jgi:hypothetical protein